MRFVYITAMLNEHRWRISFVKFCKYKSLYY